MPEKNSAAASAANSYTHYDKLVTPDENIELPNSILKWYNLAKSDAAVPTEIKDLAHSFLMKESDGENLKDFGELGFVILHRCGENFYFLLVSTWRNGNELWESVYAKDGEKDNDFKPFLFETLHRGTFCIWELAVVYHEKNAWRNYLLSARDDEADAKYLQDQYRGEA